MFSKPGAHNGKCGNVDESRVIFVVSPASGLKRKLAETEIQNTLDWKTRTEKQVLFLFLIITFLLSSLFICIDA